MIDSKISERVAALILAERLLLVELQRIFPVGSIVEYRIKAGARIQEGEIIGHVGGREARLKIRLARARYDRGEDNRYETSIPLRKIL